jgi:GT2 family glycosyltransferase
MHAESNFVEEPGGTVNFVFVVIPVFNRKEFTHDCLASLQKQDTANFTVIVVDDGSTDGTGEMIRQRFPDTILLEGDGSLWWVGSINKGICHALSLCQDDDFILVINDDLVVPSNYVSSLLNAANLHPETIIGSVETINNAKHIIKSGGVTVNWSTAKHKVLNKGKSLEQFPSCYTVEVDSLTGRGTLFPSKVFREVGLYDGIHFKQCGDTELPLRANFKFGYPLIVSYDAVVISYQGSKNNINDKKTYTLSDLKEYFFSIRSHYNLIDKFWIASNIAPNRAWLLRYYLFDAARVIGHFMIRLRL